MEPHDRLETGGRRHALSDGGVSVGVLVHRLRLQHPVLLDGGARGQQGRLHGLRGVTRRGRLAEAVAGHARVLSDRHLAGVVLLVLGRLVHGGRRLVGRLGRRRRGAHGGRGELRELGARAELEGALAGVRRLLVRVVGALNERVADERARVELRRVSDGRARLGVDGRYGRQRPRSRGRQRRRRVGVRGMGALGYGRGAQRYRWWDL